MITGISPLAAPGFLLSGTKILVRNRRCQRRSGPGCGQCRSQRPRPLALPIRNVGPYAPGAAVREAQLCISLNVLEFVMSYGIGSQPEPRCGHAGCRSRTEYVVSGSPFLSTPSFLDKYACSLHLGEVIDRQLGARFSRRPSLLSRTLGGALSAKTATVKRVLPSPGNPHQVAGRCGREMAVSCPSSLKCCSPCSLTYGASAPRLLVLSSAETGHGRIAPNVEPSRLHFRAIGDIC